MLYVVNNLQIPTSLTHSYPIFGGVQDALVQWWYGHNAVAFFLTTPILGIMYYFLPKAANRPVSLRAYADRVEIRLQDYREGADGRVERRRAFVLGFAGAEMVERLRCLGGALWIRDFGPREVGGEAVPVGTRGEDVFMEVGTGAGGVELAIFEGAVGDGALRELEEKRYVILVGMEWGVDEGFWEKLRAELPPG